MDSSTDFTSARKYKANSLTVEELDRRDYASLPDISI
jgi:hypothetical protein